LVKRNTTMWLVVTAAAATSLLPGACSSSDDPSNLAPPEATASSTPVVAGRVCSDPSECTTRQLADEAGVTLGTAVRADLLDDRDYRTTLLATFNSVTPEYELKWDSVHPEPDRWRFGPIDQIVEFAAAHDLEVKGHALIWEQELVDSTPDWVLAIDDPDELRAVVTDHITTTMRRYSSAVDRWDVVNEPLETTGTDLYDNHFRQVLGDGYLVEMFAIARQAAPGEQLWLNEAAVEFQPDKAAALVDLVRRLLGEGASIDGVGLQGHLVTGTVESATLQRLIAELEALGVEVAITELDIPARDLVDPLAVQADAYRTAFDACLAQRCREVTLWGFTDRHTWIDDTLGEGLAPLPFDRYYRPKPALDAIRERLAGP
jgi:endo-1,4-beta-xylanase